MFYNRPPDPSQARTSRKPLSTRHAAETLTIVFWGQPFTVTVGFYPDNTPGEIFINVAKSGADLAHVAYDAAVAVSLALQHGVPIEATALRRRFWAW